MGKESISWSAAEASAGDFGQLLSIGQAEAAVVPELLAARADGSVVDVRDPDRVVIQFPQSPGPRRGRPLRIAMIGQRGVPATYGGIEHHVEQLGARLVAKGHEVTVYSRTNYVRERFSTYSGMKVRYLPTLPTKHLDAIAHSSLATLVAMFSSYDIIHYHAIGPGLPAFLPRLLSRAKLVLTVHGLDARRAKWGAGARTVLETAEWLSARVPHATVVVSRDLARYYERAHGRRAWLITNGVNQPVHRPANEITKRWGLVPGRYALFVGRMVPEKAPDLLVRAFRHVPDDVRLVLAGGSSFTDDYYQSLQKLARADDRVIPTGYVYGPVLEELYSNAGMFVLPSLLEGLPLTLLEAASYGVPIVASDIPPHAEVIGSDAPGRRLVPPGELLPLVAQLRRVFDNQVVERRGAEALKDHVLRSFRWDDAVDAIEGVYDHVLGNRRSRNGSSPATPRPRAASLTH